MADPFRVPEIGAGPVRQVDPGQLRPARLPQPSADTTSFRDVLTDAIGEVQRLQTEADTTIRRLVAGEVDDPAEAIVALERADVSFQTMMAVRNKIVAAYEEIMRMQV